MISGSYLICALAGNSRAKLSGHPEFTFGSPFKAQQPCSDRFSTKVRVAGNSRPKRPLPTDNFSPNTIDAKGIVIQLLFAI